MRKLRALPVGLKPIDDEAGVSYLARVAAANRMTPTNVGRLLAPMNNNEKAAFLRLDPRQIHSALASYARSPFWHVRAWQWYCPACVARDSVWKISWWDSLYTACETCDTLLVTDFDASSQPAPVSRSFINEQRKIRQWRDHLPEVRGTYSNLCSELRGRPELWPPPLERGEVRIREMAVESLPEISANSVHIRWQRFRNPAHAATVQHIAWRKLKGETDRVIDLTDRAVTADRTQRTSR